MKKWIDIFFVLFFAWASVQAQDTSLPKVVPQGINTLKELCLKNVAYTWSKNAKVYSDMHLGQLAYNPFSNYLPEKLRLPADLRLELLHYSIDLWSRFSAEHKKQWLCLLYQEPCQQTRLKTLLRFFNNRRINTQQKRIFTELDASEYAINTAHLMQDKPSLDLFKEVLHDGTVAAIKDYTLELATVRPTFVTPGSYYFYTENVSNVFAQGILCGEPVSQRIQKRDEDDEDKREWVRYQATVPLLFLSAQRGNAQLFQAIAESNDFSLSHERFNKALKRSVNNPLEFHLLMLMYHKVSPDVIEMSPEDLEDLHEHLGVQPVVCKKSETPFHILAHDKRLPFYGDFLLRNGVSINTYSREGVSCRWNCHTVHSALEHVLAQSSDDENGENIRWLLEHGIHIDRNALERALSHVAFWARPHMKKDSSNILLILKHLYQRNGNSWQKVFDEFLSAKLKIPVAIILHDQKCSEMIAQTTDKYLQQDPPHCARATEDLWLAAAWGNVQALQAFVARGVNILQTADSDCVLLIACKNNRLEAAKYLLSAAPIGSYQRYRDVGSFSDDIDYYSPEMIEFLKAAGLLPKASKRSARAAELPEIVEVESEESNQEQASANGAEELD